MIRFKSTIIICCLVIVIMTTFYTFAYLITTVKPKVITEFTFYLENPTDNDDDNLKSANNYLENPTDDDDDNLKPANNSITRRYQIRRSDMINTTDKVVKNCDTIQVKILDEIRDPIVEIILGRQPAENVTEQKLLEPTIIYFPKNNTEIKRYFPNETIISLNSSLWSARLNEINELNFIDIKMKAEAENPVIVIDSAESLHEYFKYKNRENIKSKDVSDVIEDLDKVAELIKKEGINRSYFYKIQKKSEDDADPHKGCVHKNLSNKEVNHTEVLAKILNTIWDVTEILRWNQNKTKQKNIGSRRTKYLKNHAENNNSIYNITTKLQQEKSNNLISSQTNVSSELQLNATTESAIELLKENKT